MRKHPILCQQLTYQATTGGAEITYFVPYESTAYFCAQCREQFDASNETLLYFNLKSTIQGKVCPTCQAPLRESLVEQGIPLRDWDREPFDAEMRAKGYDGLRITEEVYAEFYDLFT